MRRLCQVGIGLKRGCTCNREGAQVFCVNESCVTQLKATPLVACYKLVWKMLKLQKKT